MEYKDINEMILGGYSKQKLHEIIRENTFNGLKAKMQLQIWRKINV